ncbi:MAG TPA: hypothetical protein HA292_03715, partial [Candidatus Nitrosotenuis sp.]|nr:hypothetical protein [Candidatus Nitrosotenuis sp.]
AADTKIIRLPNEKRRCSCASSPHSYIDEILKKIIKENEEKSFGQIIKFFDLKIRKKE